MWIMRRHLPRTAPEAKTGTGEICAMCAKPLGGGTTIPVDRITGGAFGISANGLPAHAECVRQQILSTRCMR